MSLELVKQRGKVQHDYLFKFDEYVEGWMQYVGVNVKDGEPVISEIKWSENIENQDNAQIPVLNASLYRDFPIGKVTERISHYLAIEKFDYDKFLNEKVKEIDYFTILNLAKNYTAIYPELQTKWRDERNVLLYISYYLLFMNNVEGYVSSGDLHKDISETLGISKTNSIQVLNRLKKNGYLESIENTNSLLPSVKSVKLLLEIFAETSGSYLSVFRDKLVETFFDNADDYYFNIFEQSYWDEHHGESWVANTTTYEQDKISEEAFTEHLQNLDPDLEEYEMADICYMTPVEKINKYVEEVDDDGFVSFKIDRETLSEIRKSSKYVNDHVLLLGEHLIDEILSDIGKENYLDNKKLVAKWAKESEQKSKDKYLNEDEAPF